MGSVASLANQRGKHDDGRCHESVDYFEPAKKSEYYAAREAAGLGDDD